MGSYSVERGLGALPESRVLPCRSSCPLIYGLVFVMYKAMCFVW